MPEDMPSAAEHYADVVAYFAEDSAVEQAGMFGTTGLSVGRKIFAMLHNGRLVVKLDPARCKGLVDGGLAAFFDPGHGRLMKAWVSVTTDHTAIWNSLAAEAKGYVAGLPAEKKRRR
jgi:TfoX/Sxy family transcriptional regulator of competence genes